MTARRDDETGTGRVLARRDVLALAATTAGAAVLATWVPGRFGRRAPLGAATAVAAEPSCVVRPAMTEGPYFVDERLHRSDIRSDPTTGTLSPGARLALSFVVSRIDGGVCSPFANAIVDVWQCDAAGVYSDVRDARFDTTGQQFLRGYQVTDADGVARFVTIYPGWYQGRTVHIHFKIRSDPDATTGLEFTSQLFFDDALTDVVFAEEPYATTGQRTRNASDGIYGNGGDRLLLSTGTDGAGGYVATFAIGVEASGAPTTTTTTLADAGCTTIDTCLVELRRALPPPAAAGTRRAKRAALGLRRRANRLSAVLDRAADASGGRRRRLLARAERKLAALRTASETADRTGSLGVPLAPLQAAIAALLDLV